VKRFGLTEADVHKESETPPDGSEICICGIPALSAVKTKPVTLADVQQMKKLVGIPDALYISGKMRDRMVDYPPPLSARCVGLLAEAPNHCSLNYSLTPEEQAVVKQAWLAYLVGDSRKISPEMVGMVNALHFPAVISVAALQNITVQPNQTYVFGSDGSPLQSIVVGTLTIEAGGSIAFASPVQLLCQLTNAPAPAAGFNNILFQDAAPTPPPTPSAPGQTGKGQDATAGVAGPLLPPKFNTPTCTTAATAATNGATGQVGTQGGTGAAGESPSPVVAYLGVVTGVFNFLAGGGNAQNGSPGGPGGQGGNGGNGVSPATYGGQTPCGKQGPGKGGQGGGGGTGGTPGNGANGTTSYFYYTSGTPVYNITNAPGLGGQPGAGGAGGPGGSGGTDPAGTIPNYNQAAYNLGTGSPNPGPTGNNGNAGTSGTPSKIHCGQYVS
jgi:hypothetical protein